MTHHTLLTTEAIPVYVKLFGSILDSSIWSEDNATRLVWITMLAMADSSGLVEASVTGVAHRARVSQGECEEALAVLLATDPDSKSQEFDGRRIEKVEGGWVLLNYEKYREIRSKKQVMDAVRQQRKRERDKSQDA